MIGQVECLSRCLIFRIPWKREGQWTVWMVADTAYNCDPTRDLVPLGGNVYFIVDELDFRVVKTICKYSF